MLFCLFVFSQWKELRGREGRKRIRKEESDERVKQKSRINA